MCSMTMSSDSDSPALVHAAELTCHKAGLPLVCQQLRICSVMQEASEDEEPSSSPRQQGEKPQAAVLAAAAALAAQHTSPGKGCHSMPAYSAAESLHCACLLWLNPGLC